MRSKSSSMGNSVYLRITGLLLALACQASAEESSAQLPVEHRSFDTSFGLANNVEPWATSRADIPLIKNLNVNCEKNRMRVHVEFDRPFHGMIFSKGHYGDDRCMHMGPGSGHLFADFEIALNSCGMTASTAAYSKNEAGGAYIENTIIVQYDPLVQEVWDAARRVRCTWYDYYEKSVAFKPFNVDTLQAVTANFLGDNLQCWMQIQVGKGPWASEVSGIVKIGQTMTMVLAIKDDEDKFDMLVRNCVAHDGKRQPIQLVDQNGCVVRPKVMSRFQKIRNFGSSASVVSYAYFQAFKFPDSMNVYFQCVIQVCREQCPDPQCPGSAAIPEIEFRVDPRGHPRGPDTYSLTATANLEATASRGPQALVASDKMQEASGGENYVYPSQVYGDRPLPVPVAFNIGGYPGVGRVGVAANGTAPVPPPQTSPQPAVHVGPRAYDEKEPSDSSASRRRRSNPESTDVRTTGILQVVAPGDVAFNLGAAANETITVVSSLDIERSSICLPVPGFVGGLVIILLLLAIAILIATFLFLRLRSYNNKTSDYEVYDKTQFVKSPQ